MTELPTVSDLYLTVKAIAREQPDRVSSQCRYFNDDGSCECIVGHGFGRLGITAQDIADIDASFAVPEYVVEKLAYRGKFTHAGTPEELILLRRIRVVQTYQDGHAVAHGAKEPWGRAWELAHEEVAA